MFNKKVFPITALLGYYCPDRKKYVPPPYCRFFSTTLPLLLCYLFAILVERKHICNVIIW